MNGRTAKKIRKIVYGDVSLRTKEKRSLIKRVKKFLTAGGEIQERETGQVLAGPLRRQYQLAKKMYKMGFPIEPKKKEPERVEYY